MDPMKPNAEAMLTEGTKVEDAVRSRAPREHPLYVGLGLTIFLLGLAVDLNDVGGVASAIGAALVVFALVVTVGTNVRYFLRYRQVRVRRTPMWLEWALGLWGTVALFSLGTLLDGTIDYSYTVGGAVGAVPFLLWALRLRRTA
jgi:membrane associated rhomboid family serine protease